MTTRLNSAKNSSNVEKRVPSISYTIKTDSPIEVMDCRVSKLLLWCVQFGAPAPRTALEQMAMVEQPVEHSGDGGRVAQQFAPVFDGAIGGQHSAGAFVAAHDDLQQFFGGGER